eukprot:CAMPEP_0185773092 /NCGR_PEP_ID=MMETSP1174-20130828/72287_1 /TAXON_ID=35687 /ORGANISM="Dictyocha speculum, Strain CCMP1381" /LENGTH=77 /DNA_ID=CAMNT_0028459637 /DNA_START=25 /DNA_END=258 /DNA_ORIENTATION=+
MSTQPFGLPFQAQMFEQSLRTARSAPLEAGMFLEAQAMALDHVVTFAYRPWLSGTLEGRRWRDDVRKTQTQAPTMTL